MSEPIMAEVPEASKSDSVEFKGETFTLNPDVSEWAFLEFAEAADAGQDANTITGMASLLRFVLELVHPDDQARFRALARRERVSSAELVEFLLGKAADDVERPTGRSSDSSDGPVSIEPRSDANSDASGSRTGGLGVLKGRPDLQLMVERAAS